MRQKKQIAFLLVILLLVLLLFCILKNNVKENTISITQLAPQSSRQMMGYILKTKNGKVIVIDGGTKEDASELLQEIKANGGKVDAWFLTHAHDDHVGAFTKMIREEQIEIDTIYTSLNSLEWYEKYEPARVEFTKTFLETLNLDKIKEKVIEPTLNQKIKIDGMQIEILGIKNPEITENAGNEQSMVIKLKAKKQSFLILGDTGLKSSEKLLTNQRKKLKSDFVQVAHHGQAGASKELYQKVNPQVCLWPTTEWLWNNNNGQGVGTGPWKTLETRRWMEELKVKENYIAKDGKITILMK